MNRIFLGKPVHWLMLVLLIAIGWFAGKQKTHVIHFNPFIIITLLLTIAAIVLILKTSSATEQITRDSISPDD